MSGSLNWAGLLLAHVEPLNVGGGRDGYRADLIPLLSQSFPR